MCIRLRAQVVRSALSNDKGRDVVTYWYLEAIEMPPKPWGLFSAFGSSCPAICLQPAEPIQRFMSAGMLSCPANGGSEGIWQLQVWLSKKCCCCGCAGRSTLQLISQDQKRIMRATAADNQYLRVSPSQHDFL